MNRKVLGWAALGLAVIVIAGCNSAPAQAAGDAPYVNPAPNGASGYGENVDQDALKSTIRDWSNRTMGQVSQPAWLKPLVINANAAGFQTEFGIDSSNRVEFSVAQDRNMDNARIDSDLLFAQKIAQELKRYVMTATSRNTDQGQVERLEQITSATKVTMTGTRRVTDFWQLIETVDNGQKSREYVYYIVYTIPQNIWSQVVRKYVNDVIGQIPDTATKTLVAQAYADIDTEANRITQRSDAEFRQQLRLQEQAAKDAQARAIAQINSQTAQNQAAANVAQTQVQSEANARWAAYRSGDPAVAAAASTTAADFDWISALTLGASVLK
jgi:hypothetical protein